VKRTFVFGALAWAGAACTGMGDPGRNASVQVSFATQAVPVTPLVRASRADLLDDTIVVGTDTLVLTSVEVVLKQIELERVEAPDCAPTVEDDPCEEFEFGPVLVSLPLTVGADPAFALDSAPLGSYDEIEFDVHKPDDGDPADQAFVAANPDFADISIRVRGTFNGVAFEFTTPLDVQQELELAPPLVIAENTSTNITVFVDVSTWFVVGGVLADPADPAMSDEIEQNIRNSFRAFEDPDRSGSGDDD
jgi:hypothetical protein